MFDYERNPARIYASSFAAIEAEADLGRFTPEQRAVAIRLIHACGMVEVADHLRLSDDAIRAGQTALAASAPILCDAEMVARGIIARALPIGVTPLVTLNDPSVPDLARELGTTRSAAAVDLWKPHLDGAIVVIGNAPTALFHLMERIEQGWPKPALILGFPVGFVGAAESKAALHDRAPTPYATLLGRAGGSAMAAAALNALTLGLKGDGT
jgi:precorrin-8X/cobalt-precorrin-8 methylmutase